MSIFLPTKIKVGYQEREDTYTGKLAYVIYYGPKGELRKENSWQGWRDDNIPAEEFDNVPQSGFVLNRKAGGDSWGWNQRKTYCRVYDPRGFEFEIDITNLLFILENTDSIKGKGLEGEFVYGWDRGDIILIPVGCPDYKQLTDFSGKMTKGVSLKGKDMVLGAQYLNNKAETLVYLGRFTYWNHVNNYRAADGKDSSHDKGLQYWFYAIPEDGEFNRYQFVHMKSMSKRVIDTVDTEPYYDYAMLMDKLELEVEYSPYDPAQDIYTRVLKLDESRYHSSEMFLNLFDAYFPIYINICNYRDTGRVTITDQSTDPQVLAFLQEHKEVVDRKVNYWGCKQPKNQGKWDTEELCLADCAIYKVQKHLANGKKWQ